jgi:hypothetical protein
LRLGEIHCGLKLASGIGQLRCALPQGVVRILRSPHVVIRRRLYVRCHRAAFRAREAKAAPGRRCR